MLESGPPYSLLRWLELFGMCAIWYTPNDIPLGTCKSVFLGRRVRKVRPGDSVPRLSNQMTRLNCRSCSHSYSLGGGYENSSLVEFGWVWFGLGEGKRVVMQSCKKWSNQLADEDKRE